MDSRWVSYPNVQQYVYIYDRSRVWGAWKDIGPGYACYACTLWMPTYKEFLVERTSTSSTFMEFQITHQDDL